MNEIDIGEIVLEEEIDIGELSYDTEKVYPLLENLEVTPTSVAQEFTHPDSYGYDKVIVEKVESDTLDIAPKTEEQSFVGLYGTVNVSKVDNTIDSDIQSNNIKQGVEILGVTGNVKELIEETIEVNPTTTSQVITPSEDKTGITKVSVNAVTSSIDENIKSENIKQGTTILGVTGTLEELKGEEKEATPTEETQVIEPSEGKTGITKMTVNAIPSEYQKVEGSIEITENGTFDVKQYAEANVEVPQPPTGRLIYSDFDDNGLPQTLEYVPASETETKLPDRFCSYGHSYTTVTWNSKISKIICPDQITELGTGGFAMGGSARKTLSNYDKITYAGNSSFSGSLSNWAYDHLPPNLTYIGDSAFERNPFATGINEKIQIPDTVTYIGPYSFVYYGARTEENYLTLPSALEYIGTNAFYNNGFQMFSRDELVIPAGVKTIGNTPFGGACYLTTTVTFKGTPTSISATSFTTSTSGGSMKKLVTINVPWAEGEVKNAPWGATNATINYNYTGE